MAAQWPQWRLAYQLAGFSLLANQYCNVARRRRNVERLCAMAMSGAAAGAKKENGVAGRKAVMWQSKQ